MGIGKPSLYTAFGNKESIFRRAVERYSQVNMACVADALAAPTARREHYLQGNVEAVTTPGTRRGCLSVQAGLAGPPGDETSSGS